MLLKKPKQFSKYLGYFCNKICRQELSKIAQSGHSATIYQIRSIVWTSLLHLKSEIWKKKRFTVLASVPLMSLIHNQCDQIWRNFATLAKHINTWAKFDDLFNICQHSEPTFWQKFYPIGRIFIVVNGKIFIVLLSSGHSDSSLIINYSRIEREHLKTNPFKNRFSQKNKKALELERKIFHKTILIGKIIEGFFVLKGQLPLGTKERIGPEFVPKKKRFT